MESVIDVFEHFIVEYKILTWVVFLIASSLACLCIWVYFIINGTPTIFFSSGRTLLGTVGQEWIPKIMDALLEPKWEEVNSVKNSY
jgi:hypothetical protein